jgi:MoaA/NifB/PqqE/SkfB family radical SAM enzyme
MPVELRARSHLPVQDRADVKVGFACNNRCVFCAQGERRARCGAIDVAVLAERLVAMRKTSRGLVLTGGEPTLHRNIVPLVRLAARLGFDPIQIQTNGRMFAYGRVIETLLEAGATEFSPSLHGSTARMHDALTRARGSFDQTTAGIRNLVAARAAVVTNSVIVRDNVSDLPSIVALLASLGVKEAQLAFVHPVGTAAERFGDVVPSLRAIVDPLSRARDAARAGGLRLVTEGVPLCFLRGMEDLAVEPAIPRTTVMDLDGTALDYSAWREREGKAHGPPCASCAQRSRCEGPWREYPDRLGWSEFEPFQVASGATSSERP